MDGEYPIRVDRRSVRRAAATLGRAFREYAMIRHYFPEDKKASRIADWFGRCFLAAALPRENV